MIDIKLIGDISDAFGPSGFEDDVAKIALNNANGYPARKDHMQNVYINHDVNATKPVVMLDAHTDEVGLMVQSVMANGLLKVIQIGGWVDTNVPAHLFMVKNSKGELHRAISTSKPPHFTTPEELKKPLNTYQDIHLDLGVRSRQEVFDVFGIQVGDPVMPEVYFDYNEKTGMMMGKSFDCRLGVYCVLEVMKRLKDKELPVHLTGALCAQEEIGVRGANITAKVVKPNFAIVFEGTPSDDFYFDDATAQGRVGHGVQIRHRDAGMLSNPKFIKFAKEIIAENDIKAQFTVRTGGSTNGATIHLQNEGAPVLVLGIPSRYVHTHYGYAHIDDVEATINLAVKILENMTEEKIKEVFYA